jgi:hypothetical protein
VFINFKPEGSYRIHLLGEKTENSGIFYNCINKALLKELTIKFLQNMFKQVLSTFSDCF